ncbi:MAG: antirestriction protein ArdA [Flavonifractor plautii]|nr:antirestriction protein ArdA [Flavonifractor plautii]
MPHYEYDKEYPFAAFITNLGKYNEGDLVGEWVKFPTTAEEMKQVFERIGIGSKDEFGQPYEEWFITDYDCYVDGLYDKLGEYESLDELNYLASKLDEMSQGEYEQFQAAMEIGDHAGSVQEIINLTENLDCYDVYPGIEDHDDLGRYYIEELDAMQVPEHLRDYIDYEAYGRDVALEEGGDFTSFGYVRDSGSRFDEVYDGERGSIPEEYRVMTFQDDIPEEELSEWAMDIAYDVDEFFRQRDPQYAAEHPEEHAAKEEIYENLMAGRISALDEKLAALGQTQEDYLPSEIEKFKEATGYEEFLDVDPAAIREAIQNPDKSHVDEMLAFAEQAGREYEEQIGRSGAPLSEDARWREAAELAAACDDILRNNLLYDVAVPDASELTKMILRGDTEQIRAGLSTLGREEGMAAEVAPLISRLDAFEKEHGIGAQEQQAPSPDDRETGETVRTPRGTFYVTDMSREQMEAAGYGLHHQSDDGKYLIMGNGSRAFAILNGEAQEHAAPEKMTVLVVEPMKEPYLKEIDPGLHSLQAEVGGGIAASYPFSDPVGLVCNDEGKLIGLDLNRGLRDEAGNLYDIMAGTFLVVGLGEESFASLPPELAQKYMEHFKQPEQFVNLGGQIVALPVEPENPLRTAEMTLEDDYGMIDGIINNGRKGEELDKAKEEARRTSPEKKPSIRERLEEARKECGERRSTDKAHQKKPPEHDL